MEKIDYMGFFLGLALIIGFILGGLASYVTGL